MAGGAVVGYQTYETLFGITVPMADIVTSLKALPLDQVLGTLGLYSLNSLQPMPIQQTFQRVQLRELLVLMAENRSAPREALLRAIHISRQAPLICVHPHNAGLLTHLALLHSAEGELTPELTPEHRAEVLRLLLQLADHLKEPPSPESTVPLVNEKAQATALLRSWQFQTEPDPRFNYSRLARYTQLYLEELPAVAPGLNLDQTFQEVTGVELQTYFHNVFALLSHLIIDLATGDSVGWLSGNDLMSKMNDGRVDFECLIQRWSAGPERYRHRAAELLGGAGPALHEMFDLLALRETPLIEGRPGEYIFPVAQLFVEKLATEPFFVLVNAFKGKQLEIFVQAQGASYERYVARLLESVARMDIRGPWEIHVAPKIGSDELADVVLQRGTTAVMFELKALRIPTTFLGGFPADLVLGPTNQVLTDHARSPLPIQEIRARKKQGDQGLITRGMYQQQLHADTLLGWLARHSGIRPETVYPVIGHLADLKVEEAVYLGYLKPLIKHLGLYQERFWRPPTWVHVEDLERLAGVAQAGVLDLEAFLQAKPPETRMDAALATQYPGAWLNPPQLLKARMDELTSGATEQLFGTVAKKS